MELEQDGDINEKARTYYYEKLTEFLRMVHGRRGENPAGLKTSGRNMNIGRTMSMPLQMLTLMV